MKKIIKYLQGGEYHEATVADVGDMDLLKTETKTDLVSAINEIFITGGQASGKPDGYDELVEKVEVIDSNTNNNSQSIANAVEDLDEAKRRLEQTAKEIENAKKQALADAQQAAQKAVDDYKQAREKLDNEIALAQKQLAQDIADKQSDIEKLNDEAGSLGKQLDTVRKDAEKTAEELSNAKLDFGNTKKQVVDLENEVSQKLSSTDLDPLKEKVESINSEVEQTKEQISQKVNKKDLDLLTGTVNDVKSELNLAADKIESKVSKDTLEKNISDFEVKKANLFLGTRDWLNCTFNDKALARVSSGTYKHTRVAALSSGGEIILRAERLMIGESYVVSVNARVNTGTAKIKVNDFGEMVTVDTKESNVTNRWLRYYIVFVATSDVMDIGFRGADLENGAQLFLNKAKLERGTVAFPWEQNENDDYDRAEHTEARLTVYEDQISGVVKKQTDLGDRQTEMQTTLTQVAEGVEANSKLIDKTKDGLVKEFEGKLSSTAKALSAEYAEKTNEALGQITDSGANLILNSSFSNEEDRLSKWQEVSNKANVITDDNGLSWLKMTQSGLDRDNPIGAKTNYFLVKKGKITVALDVKVDSRLDNDKILSVEFFDENNQRVDFKTFTMSELGILNSITGKQRGLIRVALDRTDVKKAAVKVTLTRNGSISVTNFLAKNSSIDDGAYTPAPEDTAEQAIKQSTKIDQNAREIQLKANKTEIDNKFVDMNNELRQEIVTQKEATLRVTNDGIENVARKVETVRGLANDAQTTANRAQSVADSANATLGAYQKSTESSFKNLGNRIESEVSSVKSSIDNMQIGGRNYLQGTADFTWPNGIGDLDLSTKVIENYNDNIKMLHVSNDKLSEWSGFYTMWGDAFPNGQLQIGDDYTLSFDAKGNGIFGAVKNESDDGQPLSGVRLTDDWKRYIVSGKINALNKAFVIYFKGRYDAYVKCVKIEKSNKASDWSPAPEDVQKQLDSNKRAIESANSRFVQVENGFQVTSNKLKTELDGKITKNSNDIKAFDDKYSRELTSVRTDISNRATQQWTQNKLEETANSVTRTIESVDTKVTNVRSALDSMQVGGVNLLHGTQNYDGWKLPANHASFEQEDNSLLTKIIHIYGDDNNANENLVWNNKSIHLVAGQQYTISAKARYYHPNRADEKKSGRNIRVFSDYTNEHGGAGFGLTTELTGEFKRYSCTFTCDKTGDYSNWRIGDWVGSKGYPGGSIYIGEIKIEEGNKATPWSPAPDDIIDNIQIGGVNLLSGTSSEISSNDAPNSGWIEGAHYNTTQPLTEKQYILSFEAKGDVNAQRIGVFLWHGGLGGGNISKKSKTSLGETFNAVDGQTFVTLTNQWKRYWVLYDVDPDNTKKTAIVGRRWVDSRPSGKVYVRKVKLEVGNKATDYSLAPEDVQGQINSNKQAIEYNRHKLDETDKKLESQYSTIQDYGNRLSAAESKVTQTANGIESTVNRIVTDTAKKNGETQNLVYNSEFINNAEGWSNIGNNPAGTILFANNEWDNWYGSNGLAFRNPSKQDYLVSESKRFRVYKGQRLSASVQLHVTDNITHGQYRAGMEIKFYANENDPEIATSNQQTQFMYNIQNGQQKLLYCENVEVPANANYVAIRLYTFGVGNIIFNQPMLVSGDKIQPYKQDVKATNSAITTMRQEADRWNVKVVGLESAINNKADKNKIITEINADTSGVKIAGNKNHITGETTIDDGVIKSAHIDKLDADKINGIEFSSGDNFYNKWEDRTRKPLMMNKNGIFASSSYIASVNDNINWRMPLGHLDTGTTYNNNCLHIATIKPKGLSGRILEHGDMIIISVQINYDNGQGDSRTTVLPQFGHSPWGEPFYEEMGESYKKGVITGDYWYTWKFKWKFEYLQQAQANGNSIPIQLRFDNLKPGSHVTITNATCWSTTKYDNGVYGYREAAFEISNDGEFRGTYLAKPVIESSRNTMDVIEWHEGRLRFAHGKEGEAPYPFGEIIINGSGINIFGQADGQDRRITFWGSTPHEQIVNNGGVTGDYDSLANGIYFDNFGNIRMSKNASKFCITRNDGTDVVQVWNHGEATLWMNNGYVSRHLGLGSSGYIDASQNGNVFFRRNGRAGYVFLSDVNIDGWLGCNSFSNRSQLSIKKDVEKADESDLATKILGIDIGTWRYKTEDADDMRHIGAVIDDVNTDKKWLIPSDFLSKDGKSVLPLNLIGGLIATVKQQAKQISDMNLKLLSLELNKDGESNE